MDAGIARIPSHDIIDKLESRKLAPALGENRDVPVDIVCCRSREVQRKAIIDFWNGLRMAIAG